MYVYLLSMYYHVIYCLIRILTSYYIHISNVRFLFTIPNKAGIPIDGTEFIH